MSVTQADEFFSLILTGAMDHPTMAAALSHIQSRGASVDELVAGARVMRRHVTPIPDVASLPGTTIDTCGTGGARKTFNVSTAAAILAAAAAPGRLHVAKHGNRGRSGRGSAEVIQHLGVRIDASPAVQRRCLEVAGVCFSFAVNHHPAMRHAAPVRQALGVPTVFNLLGPLCNPAGVRRQLMGVYEPALVEPVAQALLALGAERAMVVHGLDAIDEIGINLPTLIAHVEHGAVRLEKFDPRSLGIAQAPIEAISAPDVPSASAMVRNALRGEPGPAREIVALNAAAALVVGGCAPTLAIGLTAATRAAESGAAATILENLVRISNQQAN